MKQQTVFLQYSLILIFWYNFSKIHC